MLYTKTIESNTLGLLNDLMQKSYLQNFILVGGTALALQLGHRISVDLDLFSNGTFEYADLKEDLNIDYNSFIVDFEKRSTLITKINNIKVDFIKYKYLFSYPIIIENGIRMANLKDIAPMKLDAISGRGRKKDFFDLFFLLKHFTIVQLFELYQGKFQHTSNFHVVKSISYFEDAEKDADPIVFDPKVTWEKVKSTIIKEIRKF